MRQVLADAKARGSVVIRLSFILQPGESMEALFNGVFFVWSIPYLKRRLIGEWIR